MNDHFSRIVATFLAGLIVAATSAFAASDTAKPSTNMDHNSHNSQMHQQHYGQDATAKPENLPLEPGQGAFATIAEIVEILTNDPTTDWEKVDIDGLRNHLIDMDEVTLRAASSTNVTDEEVVFTITGTGRTLKAIQAMVPAHSNVLSQTTAWEVTSELTENGAIMRISTRRPSALKVVEALGFLGVMATGAHHQAHHLAMAKGDDQVHAHK